jgi:peptide/nickel transport system substrate-binding protein
MKKILVLLVSMFLISSLLVGAIPVSSAERMPSAKYYATPAEYEKATGKKITRFSESPDLAELVKQGKLPPVEQRLPKEPLVVQPIEKIGKYGGELWAPAAELNSWTNDGSHIRLTYMLWIDKNTNNIIPFLAKGYEFSKDARTLTLYLREGLKWSDGQPFTVDDILFWWNDVILNDELTPVKPAHWKPGGKLAKFEKIDDYTLRIRFSTPYKPILSMIAYFYSRQQNFFHPAHYLKKWHIKYNPKANELAKQEGFDAWYKAFQNHASVGPDQQDINLPTVHPWKLLKRSTTGVIYERNPYFWMVDTAGNQLPYIDRINVVAVMSRETMIMKLISGELDYAGMWLELSDYPLLKENEKKGGYTVYMWPRTNPAEIALGFNLNHKDPVKRSIFQDVRFRRAMSLAINREEINQMVFMSQGVPMQATAHPDCSFFKEEWAKAYANYDPATANKLLDEIGLKRGLDGFRLRPDGKPLEITIEYSQGLTFGKDAVELIVKYWKDVGIKTARKEDERSLYQTRALAGELDVGVWHTDRVTEFRVIIPGATKWNPRSEIGWAVQWGLWRTTGGKSGEKPTGKCGEEFTKFMDMLDQWYITVTPKKYKELAQKIWDNQADNLWLIGTVGLLNCPVVSKNYIKNFPSKCYWGDDTSWWYAADGVQWYIEK